jgi:hypothetical protein
MSRLLPLLALSGAQDTAFVFVGHARTFGDPAVHLSIKANLIDALGGGDVFWYFSERPDWDAAAEAVLRDLFRPVAIEVDAMQHEGAWNDTSTTTWHGPCKAPPLPDLAALGVPATFKFYADPARAVDVARNIYAKWARAFRLVLREEERRSRKYERVARVRFDVAWYAPLALQREAVCHVPIQTWNGINDQFALCGRSVAQTYFGASSVLDECTDGLPRWYAVLEHGMAPTCLKEMCSPGSVTREPIVWQPETFLWRHLLLENVTVRRSTVPAAIARHDGASRCTELMPYVLLATLLDVVAPELGCEPSPKKTARVLKTAHVAACAAALPCCSTSIGDLDVFSKPASEEESAQRARFSALVTTEGIEADLAFLLGRYRALKAVPPNGVVVAQINGATHTIPTSPDAAADMAATHGRFAVLGAEAAATQAALLCDYVARWPRARAVAFHAGLVLDLPCAAASYHLRATEAALHALVDDLRLTNPTYSTVSADVLGWQVWAVSNAATDRRLPETPLSAAFRAAAGA